jgi:hypothetical protein
MWKRTEKGTKTKKVFPIEIRDQKLTFSLQMKLLPKYSTLIFITASIYIINNTIKDIYVYHLPCNKRLPIKSSILKAKSNSKFHQLIDYYPYVQISYENKYINNDKVNFSGLINFSLKDSKNKEILITALISADFYEDKKYILSRLKGLNKIAIDGFFNFRLDSLKKKWAEICTFIPDFFTEREIREFVVYLLNEKTNRYVRVDGNKVFDKMGNRLNRARLLTGSGLLVFKELLLFGAKEIEIFSLPNDELEQKYLKEYFGDKIFFNSGEIL